MVGHPIEAYLTTMTLKQFLAELLATNAIQHAKIKISKRQLSTRKLQFDFLHKHQNTISSLEECMTISSEHTLTHGDPECRQNLHPSQRFGFAAAKRHGFIDLPDEEYVKKTLLKRQFSMNNWIHHLVIVLVLIAPLSLLRRRNTKHFWRRI